MGQLVCRMRHMNLVPRLEGRYHIRPKVPEADTVQYLVAKSKQSAMRTVWALWALWATVGYCGRTVGHRGLSYDVAAAAVARAGAAAGDGRRDGREVRVHADVGEVVLSHIQIIVIIIINNK